MVDMALTDFLHWHLHLWLILVETWKWLSLITWKIKLAAGMVNRVTLYFKGLLQDLQTKSALHFEEFLILTWL